MLVPNYSFTNKAPRLPNDLEASQGKWSEKFPSQLTHGRPGPNGVGQVTGPEIIVNGLRRKFGQFDVEHSIVAIIELLTFRRNQIESIDEAIARFEILKSKAGNLGHAFEMPVAALAWLFLEAMRIPRAVWPLLFANFGGQLPIDNDQLSDMMIAIRQQGHITEHTHAGPRDLYEGMKGGHNRPGHYYQDDGQGDGNWSTEWPGGADDDSQYYHGATGSSQTGYDYDADYENYIVEDDEG